MDNIKHINGHDLSGGADGRGVAIEADNALSCPFCHVDIDTQPITYLRVGEYEIEVFLRCKKCRSSFIGYYSFHHGAGIYILQKLSKGYKRFTEFNQEIKKLSLNFVKIYNESEHAEQEELKEICGMGYRKSLEFLIKDFLISREPDKAEEIKNKFLGNCIKDYLNDERIKGIAARATWLGNDETHYIKIWEDNDVGDLKKMIAILVNFIEKELLTDAYLESINKKIEEEV